MLRSFNRVTDRELEGLLRALNPTEKAKLSFTALHRQQAVELEKLLETLMYATNLLQSDGALY